MTLESKILCYLDSRPENDYNPLDPFLDQEGISIDDIDNILLDLEKSEFISRIYDSDSYFDGELIPKKGKFGTELIKKSSNPRNKYRITVNGRKHLKEENKDS